MSRGPGHQTSGVRGRRPKPTDGLQKRYPLGTPVWFYRSTVAGPVRVNGRIDSHIDSKNVEWIVRTDTGRNVRIAPSDLHRIKERAHE